MYLKLITFFFLISQTNFIYQRSEIILIRDTFIVIFNM